MGLAGAPAFGQTIEFFVAPLYSNVARMMRQTGVVHLRMLIGPDGLVKETSVTGEAPKLLEENASQAAKRWRYSPTGSESEITMTFHFGLSGEIRETYPITRVSADFQGRHIYIVTDPPPPNRGTQVPRPRPDRRPNRAQ